MNQARLTKIQEDVLVKAGTIDADTSAMAVDLAAIEVDAAAMEALLITIDADTSSMATDIGTIEADTALIKADIATIDDNIALIDADTSTMNTNLATVKDDTALIKADVDAIEVDTSAIDTRQAAQVDTLTGFHTTIDGDHRYIHEGKKFSAPLEITMAQDDIYLISFTSPTAASGKYAHWRPAVISSTASNLLVRIYENISSGETGDAVTPLNMDRNSATASVSTVKKGVTATVAAANLIAIFSVGSGGGPQSRGGGTGGGATEEMILEAETEYIIEVEEPNVAATTAVVELRWYEED